MSVEMRREDGPWLVPRYFLASLTCKNNDHCIPCLISKTERIARRGVSHDNGLCTLFGLCARSMVELAYGAQQAHNTNATLKHLHQGANPNNKATISLGIHGGFGGASAT